MSEPLISVDRGVGCNDLVREIQRCGWKVFSSETGHLAISTSSRGTRQFLRAILDGAARANMHYFRGKRGSGKASDAKTDGEHLSKRIPSANDRAPKSRSTDRPLLIMKERDIMV